MSKVKLLHSQNVTSNGEPIKPQASLMEPGVLAINYASGKETLFIKNSYGDIVTFSADKQIGDGVLTIQKNGVNIGSFSANQNSDKTINITVPTNVNELTNGSGYITTADTKDFITSAVTALSNFATSSDTITALNGKQSTISDLEQIRTNSYSGIAAYNIVSGHTGNAAIHLPIVTSSDVGKVIQVGNDGTWQLVMPSTVYTGTNAPSNTLGTNGDIYIQTN